MDDVIPCAWCGRTEWSSHCDTGGCLWLRCDHCSAILDVDAYLLLPPSRSGKGPIPAE